MKCPKCGHTFKAKNQVKGGKSRWARMSKAERKKIASAAAKARWAKRPNAGTQRPGTSDAEPATRTPMPGSLE